MNKRIQKKVYKRAEAKLMAARKPGETRSTLQQAMEDSILTPVERRVFLKMQNYSQRLFEEIKAELINERKW